MSLTAKSFRLFLSSTFSDLVVERDMLQEKVFPNLREYCEQRGFSFQVIDLRWGVSTEDSFDHRTLDICLEQVRYCKGYLKPHFAIMLSERYGWIPLPNRIERSEYELIFPHIKAELITIFNKWYVLDNNTDYYILQSITEATKEEWKTSEKRLLQEFQRIVILADVHSQLDTTQVQRYFESATEQEIIEGLFNNATVARANIHTFYRKLFNFFTSPLVNTSNSELLAKTIKKALGHVELEIIAKYVDLENGVLDQTKYAKCMALIDKISTRYSQNELSDNFHQYLVPINPEKFANVAHHIQHDIDQYSTEQYLHKFCDDFEASIRHAIDVEIANNKLIETESEESIQRYFLESRTNVTSIYAERSEHNTIQNYINNENSCRPLIIIGESGSGKSSLLAHAIKDYEEQEDSCVVLYCFIGISDESSTDYQLIRSLNKSLALKFAEFEQQKLEQGEHVNLELRLDKLESVSILEQSYDGLCKLFIRRLEVLAQYTKVIVFLDAVDQLVLDSGLEFIPNDLSNIRIIVSTLPEWQAKYVKLFKLRIMASEHGQYFINLRALNRTQMKDAYEQFKTKNKILTQRQDQQDVVLRKLMVSPLSFKIMLESSKQWRSYDNPESLVALGKLGANPSEAVKHFFVSLQSQQHLVKLSLGLLSASREGVNEGDLLDILSNHLLQNVEFKKTVINEFYKEPTKIPDSVWLRLHADLEAYLTQRSVNGIIKLALFHRIFNQVALEYASDVFNVRQILINYYKDLLASKNNLDATYRLNAYRELCYQYSNDGQFELAFALLLDQEFIYLLAGTNDSAQLVGEYKQAFNRYCKSNNVQTINNYSQFIDFYNWLINISPALENRSKQYVTLWDVLAQIGHDDGMMNIPIKQEHAAYYCEQTPIIKPQFSNALTRVEDLGNIVGVFNIDLSIKLQEHSQNLANIAHMLVINRDGNVYIKQANSKEFILIENSLGLIIGALQDQSQILIWSHEQAFYLQINVDNEKPIEQRYHTVTSSLGILNNLRIDKITLHFSYYIITTLSGVIYLFEKGTKNQTKADISQINNNTLYNKNWLLDQQCVKELNTNQVLSSFSAISQWYQSSTCVDMILGWQGRDIYLVDAVQFHIVKPLYTKHKSPVRSIYGLRNSCFLSLAFDGELHYWNKKGVCFGVIKSNYLQDMLGVANFNDNIVVIWNSRGYAIQINLDTELGALTSNNKLEGYADIVSVATSCVPFNQHFANWCSANNYYLADPASCHSINDGEFSFIDKLNNQVIFVKSCKLLDIINYTIINIWMSSGHIDQVISNDKNSAYLIVNGSKIHVRCSNSRMIKQSVINQQIKQSCDIEILMRDQKFIKLLDECDNVNEVDEYGFTTLFYAQDRMNSNLLRLLVCNYDADLEYKFSDGSNALLIASRNGQLEKVKLILELGANISQTQNKGHTALMLASERGYDEVVALLLSNGADIVARDNNGRTALMSASEYGHNEVVALLLSNGSDIVARDNNGRTALMLASEHGHSEVVALLLSNDADIAAQTKDGWNSLVLASGNGHSEVVEQLLKSNASIAKTNCGASSLILASRRGYNKIVVELLQAGADITVKDIDGETALINASSQGHVAVVTQLLSKGADIAAQTKDGWNSLMAASQNGHADVVKQLIASGVNVMSTNLSGNNALIAASAKGFIDIVQQLLFSGIDVNQRTHDNGVSALMLACHNGHVEIVKQLIISGADIAAVAYSGGDALIAASTAGHAYIVRLLLAAGADVINKDNDGYSALLYASSNGHFDTVNYLLEFDADVAAKNKNGYSALLLASRNGYTNVVKLLLDSGADITIKNNMNFNSLALASAYGYVETVKLLLHYYKLNLVDRNDDGVNALMAAGQNGHSDVVTELLQSGVDPSTINNNGASVLMYASLMGHIETVSLLLKFNASLISIIDYNGRNALMCASQSGYDEVVAELLLNGANARTKDNEGVTALMLASENGHVDVVKKLLDSGAEILVKTKKGQNALMLASLKGRTDVVKQLLEFGTDSSTCDNDDWSALLYASAHGYIDIVQLILESGADVAAKNNKNGWNALHYASENNHIDIVNQLLEFGADISATSDTGTSALMLASGKGYVQLVNQLLLNGANIESKTENGITALMYAIVKGHSEVVAKLLSAGAETTAQSADGMTVFQLAQAYNHPDVVKVLLNHQGEKANLFNNEKDESIIMKKNEFYTELFTEMMRKGYYDPTASYANRNTEILTALSEAGSVNGAFYFKLSSNMDAALAIIDENNYFQIMTKLSGQGVPKELLLEIINNAVNKMNMPVISVDEEGNFLFEYLVFTPCSVNSAISSIDWFNTAFSNFLEVLQQ